MTIKEARKILGKEANNLSDKDIERDIEIAELLRELFFYELFKAKDQVASKQLNVP